MATFKKFLPAKTIVQCIWADAWHNQHDHDEMMEPLVLDLVGHVIAHGKHGLKLAMERSPAQPSHRHVCFIPTVNILTLNVLKKA